MSDGFSYASIEDVRPLLKSGLSVQKEEMLKQKLFMASAKLSGMFPGLKQTWLNAESDSDLKNFVTAMIIEAGRKFVINPEGMSSETIGVFAYSRFDSAGDGDFSKDDLAALRAMLEAEMEEQVGSIEMNLSASMYPAAPMPTPNTYSNTRTPRSWSR